MNILLFLISIIGSPGATPSTINWPDYRGPNADGHSASTGLPLTWSDTQNVKWKTPIHGRGWSSPIVWGSQIWMTTATPDGAEQFVVCVDRETGKVLLDKRLFTNSNPEPVADINCYASPSPVIEEGRVYVHFGRYGTACLDTKSYNVLWSRRDLVCTHSVGPGSSPILFGNTVILTLDGTDQQFSVALDKRTGTTVWKVDRATHWGEGSPGQPNPRHKSFNTPVIFNVNGQLQMISPGAQAVFAYDPIDCREIWRVRFDGYSNAARTLYGNGLIYVITGYDHSDLLAIRPEGQGDLTEKGIAWKCTKGVPFKPSALLVDDLFYMVNDTGTLTCLDAKTGAEVWKERIGGDFSASPLYADGRIYFFNERGKSVVIKPGRTFQVLAENSLPAGFMASPAVTGKSLILRTKTHLYRVENGG